MDVDPPSHIGRGLSQIYWYWILNQSTWTHQVTLHYPRFIGNSLKYCAWNGQISCQQAFLLELSSCYFSVLSLSWMKLRIIIQIFSGLTWLNFDRRALIEIWCGLFLHIRSLFMTENHRTSMFIALQDFKHSVVGGCWQRRAQLEWRSVSVHHISGQADKRTKEPASWSSKQYLVRIHVIDSAALMPCFESVCVWNDYSISLLHWNWPSQPCWPIIGCWGQAMLQIASLSDLCRWGMDVPDAMALNDAFSFRLWNNFSSWLRHVQQGFTSYPTTQNIVSFQELNTDLVHQVNAFLWLGTTKSIYIIHW